MKNVLIFRTANFEVINKLIKYIKINDDNFNLYIIIQNNVDNEILDKYSDVNFIRLNSDKFLYRDLKKDKEIQKVIDKVEFNQAYIPSSTDDFSGFVDVFKVMKKFKVKEVYLFNKEAEINCMDTTVSVMSKIIFKLQELFVKIKINLEYNIKITKNIWK